MQDEKYQQKSKAISSAEPNYFVHFAMRHPVRKLTLKIRFGCISVLCAQITVSPFNGGFLVDIFFKYILS